MKVLKLKYKIKYSNYLSISNTWTKTVMQCLSKQIKLVRDWLQSQGIKVGIQKDYTDYFLIYTKNKRLIKEIKIQKRPVALKHLELFYLLHEAGHTITYQNQLNWSYENLPYTLGKNVNEEQEMHKDWFIVANIMEEHDAWRNGKMLARQLGLNLDEKAYDAEWVDAIKDYINDGSRKFQS